MENDKDFQRAIEASFITQQQWNTTNHDRRFAAKLQEEVLDEELAMALTQSSQQHMEQRITSHLTECKVSSTEDRCLGSWDCRHCTLTNRPYAPTCRACHLQAPPHVLTYATMPLIRFGLEIEMIIPNGRRDGFTLDSIAHNLSRFLPRPVRFEGYTHKVTNYWKIVTDSSICNHKTDDLSFELVSPILQGEEGLFSMRDIMDSVRRLGISTNASCGFHVHVDAQEGYSPVASLDSIKRIAQCFVSLENAFDLLVALSWEADCVRHGRRANNNRYCKSNRLAFGERSNRQRWKQISSVQSKNELVALMNPSNDRYHKLNLTNIANRDRPSTIEFRQHGGVEDLQEAEAWVRLILRFCQNAASGGTKAADVCLMPEGALPKQELLALFHLVGCNGLEQFFAVERRLFVENRLTQEWKCNKCRRKFGSSRSLSQHKEAQGH